MLDFLLGKPASSPRSSRMAWHSARTTSAIYAQDNLQVSRRLHVHFGVRWEPFMPERDTFGAAIISRRAPFWPEPERQYTPMRRRGCSLMATREFHTAISITNTRIFRPAWAWRGTRRGNGRQSIRASYGIFYDRPNTFFNAKYADAPPWGNKITTPSPAGGLADPYAGIRAGILSRRRCLRRKTRSFRRRAFTSISRIDTKATYVQQWGLSYQVQVGKDWLLSANYIGNKSTHLWSQSDLNHAIYIPGNCGANPCSTLANVNQRRTSLY